MYVKAFAATGECEMYYTPQQMRDLCDEYGSIRRAADFLGMAEATVRKRMKAGKPIKISETVNQVKEMEKEIDDLKRRLSFISNQKPKYIAGGNEPAKIIAIGDTHDQPGMSKDRFKWIAKHCAKVIPHRIIQIGDFASWDSVSTHDAPGSITHAQRPSFRSDLESCEEAMALFFKEIKDLDIPMELTAGNHEDRVQRFENKNAETVGTLYMQFEDLCARYRWRLHPYGQWLFIDGVGFTHVPKNIMGKPYGGQNSENQIANHATHSVVFGHTHRSSFRKAPKIGINNSIEVLNLGSAMPDGYVAKYAGTATSGWSYGIYELTIKSGHIISHRFIDMAQLQEQYG
jgi:predicted phosphodiesterase